MKKLCNTPWKIERDFAGYVTSIRDCNDAAVCYGTIDEEAATLIVSAPVLAKVLWKIANDPNSNPAQLKHIRETAIEALKATGVYESLQKMSKPKIFPNPGHVPSIPEGWELTHVLVAGEGEWYEVSNPLDLYWSLSGKGWVGEIIAYKISTKSGDSNQNG